MDLIVSGFVEVMSSNMISENGMRWPLISLALFILMIMVMGGVALF